MFRITELPEVIYRQVEKKAGKNHTESLQYSENMIVYTGRKGLHIFDIDRERWVFNSKEPGYQYEDIYRQVRKSDSEQGSENSQEDGESDGEAVLSQSNSDYQSAEAGDEGNEYTLYSDAQSLEH